MPQLKIPALGQIVTLEEDWTFRLFDEHRNGALLDLANLRIPPRVIGNFWSLPLSEQNKAWEKTPWKREPNPGTTSGFGEPWIDFTLRAGTELKFDRYYIKQGQGYYDSVTFRSNCVMSAPSDPLFTAGKLKSIRFWAKLDDVNTMIVQP